VNGLACHVLVSMFYLVACCRKLGKGNIFVMYLFIEMSCNSQNLLPPADKSKKSTSNKFLMNVSQKSVSCLVPHALQRWELFRIFTSKK
jgi:hypothetical protein